MHFCAEARAAGAEFVCGHGPSVKHVGRDKLYVLLKKSCMHRVAATAKMAVNIISTCLTSDAASSASVVHVTTYYIIHRTRLSHPYLVDALLQ